MAPRKRRPLTFGEVYERNYSRLLRHAARRFGPADAEDIAQETMLRAFQNLETLDSTESIWPWLRTVSERVGIDRCRRERCLPVEEEILDDLLPSVRDALEKVDVRADVGPLMGRALRRLSRLDQQALTLYEVQGVGIAEIAKRDGVSANAVRQRLFRARQNLARHYRELGGREYALAPSVPSPRTGGRAEPLERFVGFLTSHVPRVPDTVADRSVAAIASVVVAVAMTTPAPRPPAADASPERVPAGPTAVSPLLPHVGTPPGLVKGVPTQLGGLLTGGLFSRTRASYDGGPLFEGWEHGLDGWTVTGTGASTDCDTKHTGACSLQLEPVCCHEHVTVSTATHVALGRKTHVLASVMNRSTSGVDTTVRIHLDTGLVAITVLGRDLENGTIDLESGGDSISVATGSDPWEDLAVLLNREQGTVSFRNRTVRLPPKATSIEGLSIDALRYFADDVPLVYHDTLAIVVDPECSDGEDNDGDGRTDDQNPSGQPDMDCHGTLDTAEQEPATECNDGKDNDGDGRRDDGDPDCKLQIGCDDESPQCHDGVDNDGDGKVDAREDADCWSPVGPSEAAQCEDGVDNDLDGETDSVDFGCEVGESEITCHYYDGGESEGTGQGDSTSNALACVNVRTRITTAALAPEGAYHRIVGHQAYYRFSSLPYPVLCVILVRSGSASVDPCRAAGGTVEVYLSSLGAVDANEVPGNTSTLQKIGVCTAEIYSWDGSALDVRPSILTPC